MSNFFEIARQAKETDRKMQFRDDDGVWSDAEYVGLWVDDIWTWTTEVLNCEWRLEPEEKPEPRFKEVMMYHPLHKTSIGPVSGVRLYESVGCVFYHEPEAIGYVEVKIMVKDE